MNERRADEIYVVDLPSEEKHLLLEGIEIWGGPTRMTAALAVALGFDVSIPLDVSLAELSRSVRNGEQLTRSEWAQVLALTEIAFASNIFGAGWEWSIVTGLPDSKTIELLREVQDRFLDFSING